MKFVFIGRHNLTDDQKADLRKQGFTEFETVNPGVLPSDGKEAVERIISIIRDTGTNTIGLDAPGRVWVALKERIVVDNIDLFSNETSVLPFFRVYEAESRQAPELRKGKGPVPFVHVKWHQVT